jgi:outer membrane protein assembly factor BamD (BamD/ComL family)
MKLGEATFQKAASSLENQDYQQAFDQYSLFISDFPDHPYIDDAAYRIAYIHVISDDKNPYQNYEKAALLFQNFIENYPNSRYINACNNWLNILHQVLIRHEAKAISPNHTTPDSVLIRQLKNEINRLKAENAQLKQTLDVLQKAIER